MSRMAEEMKVKEDLSRMEGTYGAEMIGKLKRMKIFLSGLKGLGIETAKNLILAGPHTVTIHDDGVCSAPVKLHTCGWKCSTVLTRVPHYRIVGPIFTLMRPLSGRRHERKL